MKFLHEVMIDKLYRSLLNIKVHGFLYENALYKFTFDIDIDIKGQGHTGFSCVLMYMILRLPAGST